MLTLFGCAERATLKSLESMGASQDLLMFLAAGKSGSLKRNSRRTQLSHAHSEPTGPPHGLSRTLSMASSGTDDSEFMPCPSPSVVLSQQQQQQKDEIEKDKCNVVPPLPIQVPTSQLTPSGSSREPVMISMSLAEFMSGSFGVGESQQQGTAGTVTMTGMTGVSPKEGGGDGGGGGRTGDKPTVSTSALMATTQQHARSHHTGQRGGLKARLRELLSGNAGKGSG